MLNVLLVTTCAENEPIGLMRPMAHVGVTSGHFVGIGSAALTEI